MRFHGVTLTHGYGHRPDQVVTRGMQLKKHKHVDQIARDGLGFVSAVGVALRVRFGTDLLEDSSQ